MTSVDRGYTVGHGLAMAYVLPDCAEDGRAVEIAAVNGAASTATVSIRAVYDPEGLRVRG